MKKLISLLIAVVICSSAATAQDASFLKLFEKYNGKDGVTSVLINKEMFDTMSEMMTEEEQSGVSDMLKGINALMVLSYEYNKKSKDKNLSREMYRDFSTSIPLDDYQTLVLVNDEGSNVKIMAKKKDKVFQEFLILVGEENEATMVNINGTISLDQVSKLSQIMQMQELEMLKDMDKKPEKGGNK